MSLDTHTTLTQLLHGCAIVRWDYNFSIFHDIIARLVSYSHCASRVSQRLQSRYLSQLFFFPFCHFPLNHTFSHSLKRRAKWERKKEKWQNRLKWTDHALVHARTDSRVNHGKKEKGSSPSHWGQNCLILILRQFCPSLCLTGSSSFQMKWRWSVSEKKVLLLEEKC